MQTFGIKSKYAPTNRINVTVWFSEILFDFFDIKSFGFASLYLNLNQSKELISIERHKTKPKLSQRPISEESMEIQSNNNQTA